MEKDINLLSGVSKFFTEETLMKILEKSTGCNDVTICGWKFQPPAPKGDFYLSEIDKLTVYGEAENVAIEVKIVVKSLPKNIGRRKTFRSADFFRNEITFYTEVVPVLEKFADSKGQKHLLSVPKCLATKLDGENDFLALEDASSRGFESMPRLNCLNREEINVLIKAMANFHAISFAFKDQDEEKFQKVADKLKETYFCEEQWNWYKNYHAILMRVTKNAVSMEYPDHPALEKFNSYQPLKSLFDKSASFCNRWNAPTSVINQGDSWITNFLIKKIGDRNEEEAILLDFQLARVASPVLDISYLIYACSDKQLLDNHFDEMLKYYHTILSSAIKALGSDSEKVYPWFLFLQEVKEQWIHGLSFSMEAVPGCLLDDTEAYDLDIIEGEIEVDIAKIWNVKDIKTSAGRRRLADLVLHAYSQGFL